MGNLSRKPWGSLPMYLIETPGVSPRIISGGLLQMVLRCEGAPGGWGTVYRVAREGPGASQNLEKHDFYRV